MRCSFISMGALGASRRCRPLATPPGTILGLAPEFRRRCRGVVLEVHVAVGDVVAETDMLALLESMKMQTEIKAPSAGVVTAIHVAVGESFERGAPLIEIEADAVGAGPANSSPKGSAAQTPA